MRVCAFGLLSSHSGWLAMVCITMTKLHSFVDTSILLSLFLVSSLFSFSDLPIGQQHQIQSVSFWPFKEQLHYSQWLTKYRSRTIQDFRILAQTKSNRALAHPKKAKVNFASCSLNRKWKADDVNDIGSPEHFFRKSKVGSVHFLFETVFADAAIFGVCMQCSRLCGLRKEKWVNETTRELEHENGRMFKPMVYLFITVFSREDNKMMCNHCKKKVSYLVIREEVNFVFQPIRGCLFWFNFVSQMPENVRKMFESPLKMGQEIVNTHSYQQRHRAMIQDRLVKYFECVKFIQGIVFFLMDSFAFSSI